MMKAPRGLVQCLAVGALVAIGCRSDGKGPSDHARTPAGSADGRAGDATTPFDLASAITRVTSRCTAASTGKYATDNGVSAAIDICKLKGAYFWKADMDIDCDGQSSVVCNASTDPAYQSQTSFRQSDDKPLISSSLPYVVVPLPSSRFDYRNAGIKPGAVVAVMYAGKVEFGVFGDEGPTNIIGEASYAMAKSLGVDPNPVTGGVNSGVTYVVFTGSGAVVSPIENHASAVTLGKNLVAKLAQEN